ncbi:hypothetical protein I79_020404 [Cricetulus griseus]|uniref:Uncharacterized protein n=1 Tax=Cricetulus griseus TaxID=10029 RepID=G3I9Z0_CRIGR|nr:hypothetical protein I79_020404 [Cricetulus griseus]
MGLLPKRCQAAQFSPPHKGGSCGRPPPYSLPLLALAQQCSHGTQCCLATSHKCILICMQGPFGIPVQGFPNFQARVRVG